MPRKAKATKKSKTSKQVGTGFWSDVGDWVTDTYIKPVDKILKSTKVISKVVSPALTYLGATAGTAIGTGAAGAATGGTIGTALGEAAGGALKDYAEQHGYGNKFHNNLILGTALSVSHLNQKGSGAKHRTRAKHMIGGGSPFLNPTTSSYGGVKF